MTLRDLAPEELELFGEDEETVEAAENRDRRDHLDRPARPSVEENVLSQPQTR